MPLLQQLQTINISTLLTQIQLDENNQPICSYQWCGILQHNFFGGISQEIQAIAPEFIKPLFKFESGE